MSAGPLRLYVWNYNYSSWSMRAGIALRLAGAPFDEEAVMGAGGIDPELVALSPTGLFPLLRAGEALIWESLAIGESLAERFPAAELWPADPVARAHARSLCAEIHAGFAALRKELPMNIRRRRAGLVPSEAAQIQIERACLLAAETKARFGGDGPYLFGSRLGLADAFFAPFVMRFRTYAVDLDESTSAYAEALLAHPAVVDWVARGEADPAVSPEYDRL